MNLDDVLYGLIELKMDVEQAKKDYAAYPEVAKYQRWIDCLEWTIERLKHDTP